MKTVSIINHKGGVGKTTFTGCISQALALSGFRVLAIDNDSQHNLSSMLGVGVRKPNIHDIYTSTPGESAKLLLNSVRTTHVDGLHCITGFRDLRSMDVPHKRFLRECIEQSGLDRYYDYILIDNAPGLDMLQIASIYAADELFVPIELRQFAIDGIVEMEQVLSEQFSDAAQITRIIPNFYRNIKRHNSYLTALADLFPGKVTETALPVDNVFDEMITENKILFLHRLYSKGAAYYLKIMHELFSFNEDELWERVVEKRNQRIADDARKRLQNRLGSKSN